MAKEKDEKDLSIEERMLRFQERQLEIQERQLKVQEAAVGVQREQVKQTAPKSNKIVPRISAFNLRGEKDYPMPALKCAVGAPFYAKKELHAFDREEVELMNLVEPGTYQVELTDGSTITMNVVGEKNSLTGALEQIDFVGIYDEGTRRYAPIFTHERKQIFPALRVLLRQILGDAARDVMTMKEEARLITLPVEHPDHLPVSVGA